MHRKIWTQAYGKIPKDSKGRSYEIHHINGDHFDNRLENLKLVTIDEHYSIHYEQGDFNACRKILRRMKISPEENSRLSKELCMLMVKNGTHPWLGDHNKNRVLSGTHNFLGGLIQSKTAKITNKKRVENGTHLFLNANHQKKASARANRKIISIDDGKVTTPSNKGRYEIKTGYQHTWIDL
jgi:hypothetical protein